MLNSELDNLIVKIRAIIKVDEGTFMVYQNDKQEYHYLDIDTWFKADTLRKSVKPIYKIWGQTGLELVK